MPQVQRRYLTFSNEAIQAKIKYGSVTKLDTARACRNGLLKSASSLGFLAINLLRLPFQRKLIPIKYYSFGFVRAMELFTGGLVLPIHKKTGSFLIIDAAVHLAWYDTFKRKRRS